MLASENFSSPFEKGKRSPVCDVHDGNRQKRYEKIAEFVNLSKNLVISNFTLSEAVFLTQKFPTSGSIRPGPNRTNLKPRLNDQTFSPNIMLEEHV